MFVSELWWLLVVLRLTALWYHGYIGIWNWFETQLLWIKESWLCVHLLLLMVTWFCILLILLFFFALQCLWCLQASAVLRVLICVTTTCLAPCMFCWLLSSWSNLRWRALALVLFICCIIFHFLNRIAGSSQFVQLLRQRFKTLQAISSQLLRQVWASQVKVWLEDVSTGWRSPLGRAEVPPRKP